MWTIFKLFLVIKYTLLVGKYLYSNRRSIDIICLEYVRTYIHLKTSKGNSHLLIIIIV